MFDFKERVEDAVFKKYVDIHLERCEYCQTRAIEIQRHVKELLENV